MTNTVVQSPLVAIEHPSARRKMLEDIDANLTDAFTHIGTTGRLSLSALGDPLVVMDRQRFFAEVVAKVNANYAVLNAYQPGLALADVAVPPSVDDPVALKTFAAGIDTQVAAVNGATAKPKNSVLPAITGTPTVGEDLTCSTGTWSGSPTYAYQWQRDSVNIGGATSSTYTLVMADGTHTVRCVVTATNAGGSASANSAGQVIAAS